MATQLMPVAAVARQLGVSKKRVYQMIEEGKLEALRLGPRQTRIPKDNVEALIDRLKRRNRVELGLDIKPEKEHRRPTTGRGAVPNSDPSSPRLWRT